MGSRRIKVLMAKPDFDLHLRGVVVVATALRDAGMEVVYIGNSLPQEVAEVAMEEDVDVIGLSGLTGDTYAEYIMELISILKERGLEDKRLVVGGIILPVDVPKLKEMGVGEYFPPGSTTGAIVDYIKGRVNSKPLA
jgi:methylmalonyl-CoA mutase C-terminal domain/subunit